MKKKKFFRLGLQRQSDGVIGTAVAPADVTFVFLNVILGINDQDINVPDKGDQFLVPFAGELQRFRAVDRSGLRGGSQSEEWFVIRQIGD